MPGHSDKFSPRVNRALDLAVQAALRLQHPVATPAHLLLGILREGTGLGSGLLTNMGVDTTAVREEIETHLEPGKEVVRGEVTYSPEVASVFESAAAEAKELRSNYIGQEHLVLAMLRDEHSPVAELLASLGVTYGKARMHVVDILFGPDSGKAKVKRYNLALPEDLFAEVEKLAEREHMTVLEVLRRSVKLGLFVDQVQQNPDASIIIREGGAERQLVLL